MSTFGFARNEYERKWAILQTQFLREFNEVEASKVSGKGADGFYKPSWMYYKSNGI